MNKQKGFTTFDVLAIAAVLFWLACVVGVIYVVAHFIAKFW